ncbi:MAG TPA: hypothetical protein VF231_01235, partial [Candidatus Limnocylindrales bacterium]
MADGAYQFHHVAAGAATVARLRRGGLLERLVRSRIGRSHARMEEAQGEAGPGQVLTGQEFEADRRPAVDRGALRANDGIQPRDPAVHVDDERPRVVGQRSV